ncbi:adenine phosphoribosyltransferase [Leucobacter sp. OH1287]|uniref:adenine phosphoribosyltransferase n=1 Tax=Leucobacter sp. OH1287 TaxID=2491049 RepID=UPI002100FDFD|nr:adenine phosphoribosyltransferase [Leucobacter sp. OH1287]
MRSDLDRALELARMIPDYPEPGVLFRDLAPVLADGQALKAITTDIADRFSDAPGFDVVAGIEARGFILAGAVAVHSGCGAVSVRKAGKLPAPAASASYDLEYGSATVEVQADVQPGARVLIIDDVLATGGTALAAKQVIEAIGGEVVGVAVLCEVPELGGRQALSGLDLHIVFE